MASLKRGAKVALSSEKQNFHIVYFINMSKNKENGKNDEPLPKMSKETFAQAIQIFEFVRPYRWSLIFGIFLLFLSSMVFMIFPHLSGTMIDVAEGKSELGYSLNEIGFFLFLVLFVQSFVSYTRILLFAKLSEYGTADVRRALYDKLISLPVTFFEKTQTGELISRLTTDVEKLYSTFSIVLAEFLRQIFILVSGTIYLAIMQPKLSLIMLGTFPVAVIGAFFFGKYIRKLSKERQQILADTNVILSETMQSINVVKAFTSEMIESMRYGNSIDSVIKVAMKYARGRAIFSVFIVFVLFGALFFVIYMAARMLQADEITSGNLVSFVLYTGIIGGSLASLGNFYTELIGAIGATERIREILNTESEIELQSTPKTINTKGNIRYENVHFTYPTRSDMPILKGMSFEVKEGRKIALVGPSGAGKSTIVQLLLKFYDIQDGDITIGGKSIFDIDTRSLRANIANVPQEVILFGGTIAENIRYGKPDATDEEVNEAARQANAFEFIETFPDGMATLVGERGIKLSGGQRQRIAIARAILKNPRILLLDEATSALDAESEKLVQDALNKLMIGRTSIIIAHRLATIKEVDQIYVIDEGVIVEQGTHEELSAKENGAYQALAKLQFELDDKKA